MIKAKMSRKFDMESTTVRFVCVVNIGFLTLVTVVGVPTILTHQWTVEATVTEFMLLISAVLFNAIVIGAISDWDGNARIGMTRLLDILTDLKRRNVQLLYRGISVFKNTSASILQHVHSFASSGLDDFFSANCAYEKFAKILSKEVQTPDMASTKTKEIVHHKANSEPTKTSVSTDKTSQKGHFLKIKERYLPLKSPELFKNKIYLTRRTLINSQEK